MTASSSPYHLAGAFDIHRVVRSCVACTTYKYTSTHLRSCVVSADLFFIAFSDFTVPVRDSTFYSVCSLSYLTNSECLAAAGGTAKLRDSHRRKEQHSTAYFVKTKEKKKNGISCFPLKPERKPAGKQDCGCWNCPNPAFKARSVWRKARTSVRALAVKLLGSTTQLDLAVGIHAGWQLDLERCVNISEENLGLLCFRLRRSQR